MSTLEVAGVRRRFARWRRTRPFLGAILCLLSAALLMLPAFSSVHVGDVLVSISSIGGVSTLLLGALMAVCAVSVLTRPTTRLPAGVAAMVIALVALPAANLGGFLLGTAFGIVGAAAILAWGFNAVAQGNSTDDTLDP